MERVGTLIEKLRDLYAQQADAEKLSVAAGLLLAELQRELQQMPTSTRGKVSVMVPVTAQAMPVYTPVHEPDPITVPEETVPAPVAVSAVEVTLAEPAPVTDPETTDTNWIFDMPTEIPTMVHQEPAGEKEIYELNEVLVMQQPQGHELNEMLREEKVELATMLQDAPIRDLRKAVGINDRYLFVNNLFRGDESTYERSIKTINNFTIYAEARYWIERELKVKMGWDEQCEAVKLFDQLVKRRFA